MQAGQVVFSKCGRDKGRAFVVFAVLGDYVMLVDGALRPISKPKKKKARHTQPTKTILRLPPGLRGVTDADVRKWLLPYGANGGGGN